MDDAEPFVMVDGPAPSEAAHIYDHFFTSLARSTYAHSTIADIHSRRSHPDLNGRLFFDELLVLTLINTADENANVDGEGNGPLQVYPPQADDAESIIDLIELIQSSSFDRIKKMALWYYLMLDLDIEAGSQNALKLANRMGLPRSARYTMTAYWSMDKGDYPLAVSYLTEQPDFVPKIISALSPIRYTSTSREETAPRARAFYQLLSILDEDSQASKEGDEFEENRTVAICWTEGIRAAWIQCQNLVIPAQAQEENQDSLRSRCLGRVLEFCFMPTAREDAVKALLALALSEEDEELLCHNIINLPSGIHFSSHAHAVALDVLLVRRINSGQYYEAVMLDRRINSTIGLPHLSRDVSTDEERLKMRQLRLKRESLIRSAYLVMTRVERRLLHIGVMDEAVTASDADEEIRDLEMSWERVGENGRPSTPKRGNFNESTGKPLTPLSASPAIRKDHGNSSTSENFLAAVVKASPKRSRMGISGARMSGTASPLSQSILRGRFTPGEASVSMAQSIESPQQRTPSRSMPKLSNVEAADTASPLSTIRPYTLQQRSSNPPALNETALQETRIAVDAEPVGEEPQSGPYARLAEQLKKQLDQSDGDFSVDRILAVKSPFRSLQSSSGATTQPSQGSARQGSLSFSKPSYRYEARYEIGDESDQPTRREAQRTSDEENHEDVEMEEIPKRRGQRAGAPKKGGKADKQRFREEVMRGDDGDGASIPGTFPGQTAHEAEVARPKQRAAEESQKKKRTTATRSTPKKAAAAPQSKAANPQDDQDELPDLPDLPATPSIRKSRSGAGLSRARSTNKVSTSTPIRRSARLSVEPESRPPTEPTKEAPTSTRRSRRATSKGPSLTSASERDETENEEVANTPARRSRRVSKMPGTFGA